MVSIYYKLRNCNIPTPSNRRDMSDLYFCDTHSFDPFFNAKNNKMQYKERHTENKKNETKTTKA